MRPVTNAGQLQPVLQVSSRAHRNGPIRTLKSGVVAMMMAARLLVICVWPSAIRVKGKTLCDQRSMIKTMRGISILGVRAREIAPAPTQ